MQNNKHILLDNALKLVPFDGWTDYTFTQAAKNTGLSEAECRKMFPAGIKDVLALFHTVENDALVATLPPETLSSLRVPQRIEKIILTQLKQWQSKREIIRRTISYNSMPWNNLEACKDLYDTVDLMWGMAGDNSTDFSFYTKRMTLAAVYSSTVLFWLNDTSDNHEETVLFLRRRLGNVASFGRFKKKLEAAIQKI